MKQLTLLLLVASGCVASPEASLVGTYHFDSERDPNPEIIGIEEYEDENPGIASILKASYVGASLTLRADFTYSLTQNANIGSTEGTNMVTRHGTWLLANGAICTIPSLASPGLRTRQAAMWATSPDGSIALQLPTDPADELRVTWVFTRL